MLNQAASNKRYFDGSRKKLTNEMIVAEFNQNNGIPEEQRHKTIQVFKSSQRLSVERLIDTYLASMNQDRFADWSALRPSKPEIVHGAVARDTDEVFDILGIGGMFAYLNVLYQAHKHGGKHCIITNPMDIFTFSGWTLHPEEDMDQRLIEMFQTRSLFINELKGFLGLLEPPEHIRYKSFRIDYGQLLNLLREDPKELVKNVKVALQYALLELTDSDKRFAKINLHRNRATLAALEQMGRIGDDPDKDIVNLCGRVVFEVEKEARIAWKHKLKEQFGLLGKKLSIEEVQSIYGAELKILEDIKRGELNAVRYGGGHFITGYKANALKAAKEKGVQVYDNAVVTKIILDRERGRHAVVVRLAGGEQKTIAASTVLMALGDYGEDVITVDGVSTLFAVITQDENYRLCPTGMGEGGTIHVVPVWSMPNRTGANTLYYHLGKATNGAIMGRNPVTPKSLHEDRAFLAHLEASLNKIIPPDSTFIWLAATECGRPVSAKQGYSIYPLQPANECDRHSPSGHPLSFRASGGCGLGGNTAIIPEVQAILDGKAGMR
jgi:hypothetical protein